MTNEIDRKELITRREAIHRVSAMLGGVALIGQSAMLAGCAGGIDNAAPATGTNALFTRDEIELLDEIAETILPETGTPGARDAGVGPFMAMMVAETYQDSEQQVFRDGLRSLQERCQAMHAADFASVTPAQRLTVLQALDVEQHRQSQSQADDAPGHYFRMMKELTLLGYFTSEIGCTQAQRYVESPGRFDPCVQYAEGEKTWANHA